MKEKGPFICAKQLRMKGPFFVAERAVYHCIQALRPCIRLHPMKLDRLKTVREDEIYLFDHGKDCAYIERFD